MIKELIGKIESALDEYQYEKFGSIELDDDTEMALYKECKYFFEHIKEEAEELDETIDEHIEEANEPSDYDYDMNEYESMRSRELRGA